MYKSINKATKETGLLVFALSFDNFKFDASILSCFSFSVHKTKICNCSFAALQNLKKKKVKKLIDTRNPTTNQHV